MARRSRVIQSTSLELRLTQEAKRLREEALQLPPGAAREELIRKARQAETGSHMSSRATAAYLTDQIEIERHP